MLPPVDAVQQVFWLSYCKSIKEIFDIKLKCFGCFSLKTFLTLICACKTLNQVRVLCWKTYTGKILANRDLRTCEQCSHPQAGYCSYVSDIVVFPFLLI